MKKFLFSLTFSLFSFAAFAADVSVEEAVTFEPGFTWTGGYIGGQVGYAWGDATADYSLADGSTDIDPDGWLGGVYIGYNYQLANNIVFGAEADVVYTDVDGRGQFNELGVPIDDSFDSLDLNWSGALRGRVGYAVGHLLPYFSAGIAFGDVYVSAEDVNPNFVWSWSETYIGYTVGAGAEYAATDNLIFRAEYRYTDLGSDTFVATELDSVHDVDLSMNEVRFGIAYKF